MSEVCFESAIRGLPEFAWTVKITAACPNCSTPIAVGGGLQGGGAVLKCSACKYHSIYPEVSQAALERAVLEEAALRCGDAKRDRA